MKYKNIDEIKNIKEFEYKCYYCGKITKYKRIIYLLKRFKKYNMSDEDILDFFNDTKYNLCIKCAD